MFDNLSDEDYKSLGRAITILFRDDLLKVTKCFYCKGCGAIKNDAGDIVACSNCNGSGHIIEGGVN